MALDRDRYRISYTLPADMEENMRGKKTEGDFPHLYAFIEFLITAAKLKVLNRDQWESFLPFNKTVGWGLEGYSEDSACEYSVVFLTNCGMIICSFHEKPCTTSEHLQ